MPLSDEEFAADILRRRADQPKPDSPKKLALAERLAAETKYDQFRQQQVAEFDRKAVATRKATLLRDYITARGTRYAKCSLDNFACTTPAQRKALATLRGYCDQLANNLADGFGVTLFGPCGTGKDHLAAAICRQAIMRLSKRIRWVDGMRLFGDLRDSFDSTKASEGAILDSYTRCDVLAISDPLPVLGDISTYQASALFRIIDSRYSAMRPTIMTVNVNAADADRRLGAPIVDRLRDSSLMVHCNWDSYRKQEKP